MRILICFDLIIIDDLVAVREQTLEFFLAQSNELIEHVKGFPVREEKRSGQHRGDLYRSGRRALQNSLSECNEGWVGAGNRENNEGILLASIGAVVQPRG